MNTSTDPLLRDVRFQLLGATRYTWGILVEYVGRLDDLVASGAVSEHMARALRRPRGQGRRLVDEYGDWFRRTKSATKAEPDRIVIKRHIHDEARALSLPGVRECVRDADRTAIQVRSRCVGRNRRAVRWTAIGDVFIYINWTEIRWEADLLRQGGAA